MAVTYISDKQVVTSPNTEQRKYDVDPEIYYDRPDATPLLFLSQGPKSKITKRKVSDVEYKFFEKQQHAHYTQVDGATYSTATVITVVSAAHFTVGDVVKGLTGEELLRVTSYNTTGNTITVTRGYGTTTATTLTDNEWLLVLANPMKEGSTTPEIKQVKADAYTNLIQTFRTPLGGTHDHLQTEYWTGKPMEEHHKEAMFKHKLEIEKAMLLSEKTYDSTNVIRQMSGIWNQIAGANDANSGQITSVATTLTLAGFLTILRKAWEYNDPGDTMIMLAAPYITEAIMYWKENRLVMKPSDEYYGLKCAEWVTNWGTLQIFNDWLFASPGTNAYDALGGRAVLFNPKFIKYVYFDRDSYLWTNTQDNNYHGRVDEYMTQCSVQLDNAKRHHVVKGVLAYS